MLLALSEYLNTFGSFYWYLHNHLLDSQISSWISLLIVLKTNFNWVWHVKTLSWVLCLMYHATFSMNKKLPPCIFITHSQLVRFCYTSRCLIIFYTCTLILQWFIVNRRNVSEVAQLMSTQVAFSSFYIVKPVSYTHLTLPTIRA